MRTPEQEAALRSILKLIDFWGIAPDELHDAGAEVVSPPPPEPKRPKMLEPKYRHPQSGETWDGLGSQPPWLRQALTREGYTVEELRCAPVQPDPEAAA